MDDGENTKTPEDIVQFKRSTLIYGGGVVFILFVIFVIAFVGPYFHCEDQTHHHCQGGRQYGIYCEDFCVYGRYGPGPGLWFFLLMSLPIVMIVQCYFDNENAGDERSVRIFI